MSNIEADARTYFCKSGYYNDMATLFFNSQEEAIKQLFHQPGKICDRHYIDAFMFYWWQLFGMGQYMMTTTVYNELSSISV